MINKQASNLEGGQLGFTWADIPAGETCQAATHGGTGDRTLQVEGVFGGATVLLEGSLNGTGVSALVVAGGGGSSVWPSPSEVALGVSYGPTGSDYVGTKPPGGAYLRRR